MGQSLNSTRARPAVISDFDVALYPSFTCEEHNLGSIFAKRLCDDINSTQDACSDGYYCVGGLIGLALSLLAMGHADSLNSKAMRQSEIALVTERLNASVYAVVMDSRGIYMSKSTKDAEPFAKGIDSHLQNLKRDAARLNDLLPAGEAQRGRQVAQTIAEFAQFRTELARLGREVSPEAADKQGNNDVNRANRRALNDLLVAFSKRNAEVGAELDRQSTQVTQLTQMVLPAVLMLLLGGAMLSGLFFARRTITRPLLDLRGVMTTLAGGNLSVAVPHEGRVDEIGDMARAVAVLRESSLKVAQMQEQERLQALERLQRAQHLSTVVTDVSNVVSAAANGDFSARLDLADADTEVQKLVDGINEINAVVGRAVTEFAETLQGVAKGDLSRQIDTAYRGRFGELKAAINDTVDRLASTVTSIQRSTSSVMVAAQEIASGADDLSRRTEQQASNLEETAATTEQLTASVKASANSSQEAAKQSSAAMRAAQAGGAIVGEAVDAMARVEEASRKISDITRVIDDIAFQTNLLALNAAVEAARAGEAGKGFAVVASEVRTLAQRSSEAAKAISGLISAQIRRWMPASSSCEVPAMRSM